MQATTLQTLLVAWKFSSCSIFDHNVEIPTSQEGRMGRSLLPFWLNSQGKSRREKRHLKAQIRAGRGLHTVMLTSAAC